MQLWPGARLRLWPPNIRGVASRLLPLHQGRGRPVGHRHLLLGQLCQGWVSLLVSCEATLEIAMSVRSSVRPKL